jgi:hypothetical protein
LLIRGWRLAVYSRQLSVASRQSNVENIAKIAIVAVVTAPF